MEQTSKSASRTYLDYMDKTFLEELNYKLWSTKGARFQANARLQRMARLSGISTSLLSAYLVAAGLLSVYNIYSDNFINENVVAYVITSLSIILMVFSQVEASKQYDLKARAFLECALALSRLYDELRIFKTLKSNPSEEDKVKFAQELTDKYEDLLSRSDNHAPIDYDIFKTKKAKYHLLSSRDVLYIKIKGYFVTSFFYHILIVSPLVILLLVILNGK